MKAHCLCSTVGDTVNVSSRMESNSDKNRIHLSDTSTKLLRKQAPELRLESRGLTHIKGKVTGNRDWAHGTLRLACRQGQDAHQLLGGARG
jgi:class 3 adenylate cyclase